MAKMCTQSDAAVATLENKVAMPGREGMNWGLNPWASPASREPGRTKLKVSGCQDQARRRLYTRAMGRKVKWERAKRRVRGREGAVARKRVTVAT